MCLHACVTFSRFFAAAHMASTSLALIERRLPCHIVGLWRQRNWVADFAALPARLASGTPPPSCTAPSVIWGWLCIALALTFLVGLCVGRRSRRTIRVGCLNIAHEHSCAVQVSVGSDVPEPQHALEDLLPAASSVRRQLFFSPASSPALEDDCASSKRELRVRGVRRGGGALA